MSLSCFFCNNLVTVPEAISGYPANESYYCPLCGHVFLTPELSRGFDLKVITYSDETKKTLINILRNEWEKIKPEYRKKPLTSEALDQKLSSYIPLEPVEKINNALLQFEKATQFVGSRVGVNFGKDYPLYHCEQSAELIAICKLTYQEGLTTSPDPHNPHLDITLTSKGYERIRDLKNDRKDSKQCFVAMWFGDEVKGVFEEAIQPAIEFTEEGEEEARFRAVKIDNVEHTNDINDEIIAQIRRSRFMVCDLTGYRGGVNFEAGFAYGLGLEVIYTCRQDWTREEVLEDKDGNEVKTLQDKKGKEIRVRKEGVHFDLAHRNRIQWSPDDLPAFRKALENRIKAVIV